MPNAGCGFDAACGQLLVHHYQYSPTDQDERALQLLKDIRAGSVRRVEPDVESIHDKVNALHGHISDGIPIRIHRIYIVPGEEVSVINELHHIYRSYTTLPLVTKYSEQFFIEPNLLGRLESFTLRQEYVNTYKPSFSLPNPQTNKGSGVRIRVLDSGIEDPEPFTTTHGKNYADPLNSSDLTDARGHGTAVASLIHDIAEDAEIIVSKVVTPAGVNAWDTLAAILDHAGEHILNLSVSFGFSEETCNCGRRFPACRSKVFESVITNKLRDEPDLIILAAAGNLPSNATSNSEDGLRYPAKFANVIAIGCIDGSDVIYGYYGKNENDDIHRHLYFMPGGGGAEYIGTSVIGNNSTDQQGTSFSTACASGLLAVHRSNSANRQQRDDLLDDLRTTAKKFQSHDQDKWGNGILRIQP